MRHIVLFCGHIGSGKDTAANYFISKYGFTSSKMAGSLDREGSLKRVVWEIFNLDKSKVEDRKYRESPHPHLGWKTPRAALQYFGHQTRQFMEDVWVRNTMIHISTLEDSNIVLSDIRYLNEYEVFLTMQNESTKLTLVAIKNPKLDLTQEIFKDPSEEEIPLIQERADYTIYNNSTLEEFYKNLDYIYNIIQK